MKPLPFLSVAMLFLASSAACAATYTWDNSPGFIGSGNGVIDDGSGTWDSSAGNWTLGSGATNVSYGNLATDAAIIGTGGLGGTITVADDGINAASINFGATTGAGYTVAGGPINLSGPAPSVNAANSAFLTTISSVLTGNSGVNFAASGGLLLTASNTYSGGTTLTSGTLIAGNVATFGSGTIVINSGSLCANHVQALSGNAVTLNAGGVLTTTNGSSSTLGNLSLNGGTLSANASNPGGNWILTGTVSTLGGGNTSKISGGNVMFSNDTAFDVAAGDTLNISSTINWNNGDVTKNGGGTLAISSGASYPYKTLNVNAGTLALSGMGSWCGGRMNIHSGATVTVTGAGSLSGQSITINAGGVLSATGVGNLLPSVILNGGTLSVTGPSSPFGNWTTPLGISTSGAGTTSTVTGGTLGFFNNRMLWTIASGDTVNLSSVIVTDPSRAPSAYVLTKEGAGVLVIRSANTFIGSTAINAGRLVTGNTYALSVGSVSVASGAILQVGDGLTDSVTLGSGANLLLSPGGTITFNATSSRIALSGSGAYNLTGGVLDLSNMFNSAGTYALISGGSGNTDFLSSIKGYDATRFAVQFSQGLLTVTSVPELETFGLFAASGGTALVLVRTIRRKRAAKRT